jgi:hypothetical protein
VGCIFSACRPQLDKEVVAVSGVRVTLLDESGSKFRQVRCVSRHSDTPLPYNVEGRSSGKFLRLGFPSSPRSSGVLGAGPLARGLFSQGAGSTNLPCKRCIFLVDASSARCPGDHLARGLVALCVQPGLHRLT